MLDQHLDEIADADLDLIVVVNPGCYRQLQQGLKRRGLAPASCTSPSCWPAIAEARYRVGGSSGQWPCSAKKRRAASSARDPLRAMPALH